MVLHGHHCDFDIERTVGVAQAQHIGELERSGAGEKDFARSSEFNDSAFGEVAQLRAHFAVTQGQLYGDTNGRSVGEKSRQCGYCARSFRRPPRGYG